MIDFYSALKTIIQRGEYVLEAMEDRINTCWLDTRITTEQRDELLSLAAENARDEYQVDVLGMLAEHDRRLYELEHPTDIYPIWQNGQITKKGDVVRCDVTGDGEYDLCLFDGGNPQTSLHLGKIAGWFMLDRELNRTHEIWWNTDTQTYTLTPIESEQSETE